MSPPTTTHTEESRARRPAAIPATGPPPGGDSRRQVTARVVGRSSPTHTTSQQDGSVSSRRSSTVVAPSRARVLSTPPIRRDAPPHRTITEVAVCLEVVFEEAVGDGGIRVILPRRVPWLDTAVRWLAPVSYT